MPEALPAALRALRLESRKEAGCAELPGRQKLLRSLMNYPQFTDRHEQYSRSSQNQAFMASRTLTPTNAGQRHLNQYGPMLTYILGVIMYVPVTAPSNLPQKRKPP